MLFFVRVVLRSLSRQAGRRILIGLTITLCTTVCVAMLGIAFDVGDKVKAELTTYGSNIVVRPKAEAVVAGLYGATRTVSDTASPSSLINESDVTKIKTIFWAFNIVDMAPRLDIMATVHKTNKEASTQEFPHIASLHDHTPKLDQHAQHNQHEHHDGSDQHGGHNQPNQQEQSPNHSDDHAHMHSDDHSGKMQHDQHMRQTSERQGQGAEQTVQTTAAVDSVDTGHTAYTAHAVDKVLSHRLVASDQQSQVMNIADEAHTSGHPVIVIGTWFHRHLQLPTGETTVLGLQGMRSWWKVQGAWAKDCLEQACSPQAMVGQKLAEELGLHIGDRLTIGSSKRAPVVVKISGIYASGDEDDQAVYVPSVVAQAVSGLYDGLDQIEIKALTTPENALAKKAARDPAALSKDEWETWYCTAYPSSIAYQIEEALPGVVARQVRQVAALQGEVLNKTQTIMIVMTVLSLLAAAIAVANLMASSIAERSGELALLKAIGATNGAVCRLMMSETAVITFVGACFGAGVGSLMAQLVGHVVFHVGVTMRPLVFVVVAVLLALTVLLASFSAIRSILGLHPAEVLHDR